MEALIIPRTFFGRLPGAQNTGHHRRTRRAVHGDGKFLWLPQTLGVIPDMSLM